MAQQWVTIQQVMEELGVARSTIDKWRRDGNFPKFRKYPNGSLRVEQAAVESWRDSWNSYEPATAKGESAGPGRATREGSAVHRALEFRR